MSKRKPYVFQPPARPMVKTWRSLEDKNDQGAAMQAVAAAEHAGGFMGGAKPSSISESSAAESGGHDVPTERLLRGQTKQNALLAQPRMGRRGFLSVAGAGAAALGAQGCVRRPENLILPYTQGPEYSLPGIPLHFATVTQRGSDALGLLVTTHEGRPTKVEGNPSHPSSLGATDMRAQQMVWDLYDPDRSQGPARFEGGQWQGATYDEADAALREAIEAARADGGRGLRVLMRPTNSPSEIRMRDALLAQLPSAKVHVYAPWSDDAVREGTKLAFGQPMVPVHNLARADVIVAIDADFLGNDDSAVRDIRGFAARRAIANPEHDRMSRLYAVESTFSVTGANADHRLRVKPSRIEGFLLALARAVEGRNGATLGPSAAVAAGATAEGFDANFLDGLADDLTKASGRAVIVVGPRQPARVHALAAALNAALGGVGAVVSYFPAIDPDRPSALQSLSELVAEAEQVRTLLILGGNPVYDTPGDVDFGAILAREGVTSFHLGSHRDETSQLCTWHLPLAHELECWGDQQAADGTLSIQQPTIQPLWGARSSLETLAMAAGEEHWRGHTLVRRTLREQGGGLGFERGWRAALHAGVVPGSSGRPADAALQGGGLAAAFQAPAVAAPSGEAMEVVFAPDPCLWDGAHANNLWALETPDPMTKVVWDNVAICSYATRRRLGLENGAMIKLSRPGARAIEVPVWALPGHADDTWTLVLGWGRPGAGRYGTVKTWQGLGPGIGIEPDWRAGGFDVNPLRTLSAFYSASDVTVEPTGGDYDIVQTQTHGYMEGRPVAIDATLDEYRQEPEFASYRTVEFPTGPLWDEVLYGPRPVTTNRTLHKWGMVIDLSACVGCNACVVACQAENNIPCVGKQEVARGREMAWLRIDRYFVGEDDIDPGVTYQPIACQQCEEAPCENVCPVNATAHSPEGLNDMAYNRCIGTRYCANNCPYKVRRFNYLDWHAHLDDPWTMHGAFPETRKMGFNPNVTVRSRGVMEKCTYCVQRIQEAKFAARREHRAVRDGDIQTACQQVCPAEAIVFGDLNDPRSRVAQRDAVNRRYKLLAELGTQPRTTFLGRIRNPNPLIGPGTAAADEESH